MSQKNKSDLKKMFVSQAIPTESNFIDLIDSSQDFVHQVIIGEKLK